MLSLQTRVVWAERTAASVMREPSLYSVHVDLQHGDGRVEVVDCGFQHSRLSWLGYVLDVCMVRVGDAPATAVVTSHGTYRRRQLLQLAAIKEWVFPPRPLDLRELTVEPQDAAGRMVRHVWPAGGATGRPLGLVLLIHDGTLAWQGVIDVPQVGIHTVIVAAAGGVLFHKFDRYWRPDDSDDPTRRE